MTLIGTISATEWFFGQSLFDAIWRHDINIYIPNNNYYQSNILILFITILVIEQLHTT